MIIHHSPIFNRNAGLSPLLKGWLMVLCTLLPLSAQAQRSLERGYASITEERSRNMMEFLADDLLEGRDAGMRGGQLAARYITSLLREWGVAPLPGEWNKQGNEKLLTNLSYMQPFDVAQLTKPDRGPWQVHPDSIAKVKERGAHRLRHLNNLLAYIPGKRTDEWVIVGAHYDHEGTFPDIADDGIYNGADDNASGVVAVLQMARAFVMSGEQPERSVIFAFWDGEEKGLLGSRHFVANCKFIDKVKCYLNFDMIGRGPADNPKLVSYFFTESHPAFGKWLTRDLRERGWCFEPSLRPWDNPVGGSDNGSFARKGVPIIWYHTEGHPDYTRPSDTADKINYRKMTDICRASFLTGWKMANEKAY